MKKIITITLLFILLLSGCMKINTPGGIVVWGSKDIATRTLNLENFNQIIVGNKFHVVINQGENYSTKVKINNNLMEFLQIEKKWTTLSIKMKPNHFYKDAILEVEITIPELEYLDISGMSSVDIQNFNVNNLQVEISEASELNGNVTATNLDLKIKNGSKANLAGKAMYLKLEGVIGAEVDFGQLAVDRANIYLSVGSEGQFQINETVNAGIKNGSILTYTGAGVEGKILKDDSSKFIKK